MPACSFPYEYEQGTTQLADRSVDRLGNQGELGQADCRCRRGRSGRRWPALKSEPQVRGECPARELQRNAQSPGSIFRALRAYEHTAKSRIYRTSMQNGISKAETDPKKLLLTNFHIDKGGAKRYDIDSTGIGVDVFL